MGAFATTQDRAECSLQGQANPPNKDRHGPLAVRLLKIWRSEEADISRLTITSITDRHP